MTNSYSVVSGESEGQKRHDDMVAEQLAKEFGHSFGNSYTTKSQSDSDMVKRILSVGTPAHKALLAIVLDVTKDGQVVISGTSLEEIQSKRELILKMYDTTYTPTNGLQGYGQDPNRTGKKDPNDSGLPDPNGRRSM